MNDYLLISDAAKEVCVETHVLRYWEEELKLPIKRNELGHRYYTKEDVERFKRIRRMKEKGLQLKAIRSLLFRDTLSEKGDEKLLEKGIEENDTYNLPEEPMRISIVDKAELVNQGGEMSKEEKSKKLQWLLQQMIREALQENNQELCREIRDGVIKELDYQFRNLEEREDEREQRRELRDEEYYKRMDDLLRSKSKGLLPVKGKPVDKTDNITDIRSGEKKTKKKRHSIF